MTKEIKRQQQMEIQICQLIKIVANLVERIERLENVNEKSYIQKIIPLHKHPTY